MWGRKARKIRELEKEIAILRKELELCGWPWPLWDKEIKPPAEKLFKPAIRPFERAMVTTDLDFGVLGAVAAGILLENSGPGPEKFEDQGGNFGGGGASGTWDNGGSPDSGSSD